MSDLLLGQADLANGASGVADGEDRDSMAFAALTLGAAGAMTDGALEQGAAEDVARGGGAERGGVRVVGWSFLDSSILVKHKRKQIARKMFQKLFLAEAASGPTEPYTCTAILASRHTLSRLAIQTKEFRPSFLRQKVARTVACVAPLVQAVLKRPPPLPGRQAQVPVRRLAN